MLLTHSWRSSIVCCLVFSLPSLGVTGVGQLEPRPSLEITHAGVRLPYRTSGVGMDHAPCTNTSRQEAPTVLGGRANRGFPSHNTQLHPHLAQSGFCSTSIQTYMAAIRHMHTEAGFGPPAREHWHQVHYVLLYEVTGNHT